MNLSSLVRTDPGIPEGEVHLETPIATAARHRERARTLRICRRMAARLFQLMQDYSITPEEVFPDAHRPAE